LYWRRHSRMDLRLIAGLVVHKDYFDRCARHDKCRDLPVSAMGRFRSGHNVRPVWFGRFHDGQYDRETSLLVDRNWKNVAKTRAYELRAKLERIQLAGTWN
jgi:hypothetical protein